MPDTRHFPHRPRSGVRVRESRGWIIDTGKRGHRIFFDPDNKRFYAWGTTDHPGVHRLDNRAMRRVMAHPSFGGDFRIRAKDRHITFRGIDTGMVSRLPHSAQLNVPEGVREYADRILRRNRGYGLDRYDGATGTATFRDREGHEFSVALP